MKTRICEMLDTSDLSICYAVKLFHCGKWKTAAIDGKPATFSTHRGAKKFAAELRRKFSNSPNQVSNSTPQEAESK